MLMPSGSGFGAVPIGGSTGPTTGGPPGLPGAGGKPAGDGVVSIPRGSVGSRGSRVRSVDGGIITPGAGAGPGSTGLTGSPVPPARWMSEPDSPIFAVLVVPATGDMVSPEWPAMSVRAMRTVNGPLPPATLNWAEPSASGRVGTGVQLVPFMLYSSLNLLQSGLRSVIFQPTLTSSPVR